MIVKTIAHGKLVLKRLMRNPHVAVDTETQAAEEFKDDPKAALIITRSRVKVWSMCHRGESYSFPTNLIGPQYPTMAEWVNLFRPMMRDSKIRKVFHNFNYDGNVFLTYGLAFSRIWDTIIGCHFANANYERDLKSRANLYGRYLANTRTVDFNDLKALADYAEDDVIATDEIYQMQMSGCVIRSRVIEHIDERGILIRSKQTMPQLEISPQYESLSKFDRTVIKYQELPILRAVIRAEQRGFPLDRAQIGAIRTTIKKDQQRLLQSIYRHAGQQFSLRSTPQKVKVLTSLGIKITKLTKKGAPSVGYESLFFLIDSHPIIKDMIKYTQNDKLLSVYASEKGLVHYADKNDRIHSTLNSVGARTGRFSCVAGDTILQTSRGAFRFDEYLPQQGDTVTSHLGNQCQVLRKIYKGVDEMFELTLSNGNKLKCTGLHKLYSVDRWISVAELTVGAKVTAYEHKPFTLQKSRNARKGRTNLRREIETYECRNRQDLRNESSDCNGDTSVSALQGGVFRRESVALLTQQDGGEQPYDGQEWFAAPQLHGSDNGRGRVSDNQSRNEVSARSHSSMVESDRATFGSYRLRPTSHRREQGQLPYRQLVSCDRQWPSRATLQTLAISEIRSLGTMGVWDIEVEGDHSYRCQGFLNHNSSNPNLQNIPSAKDTYGIRSCFIAPRGQNIICLDFSQIEIRVMAILSKDPEMQRVLRDPHGDIHQNTATKFNVARSPIAKQINFLMLFGGGNFALANKLTLEGAPTTKEVAQTYIDRYNVVHSGIRDYRKGLLQHHQRHDYVRYLLGRKRYLINVDWSKRGEMHKAETTLANNVCQGSAQDLLKHAIIRCDPLCINPDQAILGKLAFSPTYTALLKDYGRKIEKLRREMRLANVKWALQVHDESLWFCDASAAQEIGQKIAEVMTWFPYIEPTTSFNIPIAVDGGVGETWAHAKGKNPIHKIEHFGKVMDFKPNLPLAA